MNPFLLNLDPGQLGALVRDLGEKPFRANQLWQWLHARRVSCCDAMTNLSTGLRTRLAAQCRVRTFGEQRHLVSKDGLTEKWLWQITARTNADNPERDQRATALVANLRPELVEAVLIRQKRLKRATACVSSMIGCPLSCRFCATGQGGFGRNLTRGEILEQVYRIDERARELCLPQVPAGKPNTVRGLTNVVFMGMGEPLLNLDEVLAAARTLTNPDAMGMSGRHITISTIGIPDAIDELTAEATNFRLAVSLHAPEQKLREELLPATRAWPLDHLMTTLREFSRTASRDITIEYCLVRATNDKPSHARALARLLGSLPCKVNLIPLNPVPGFCGTPPTRATVRTFQDILERSGMSVTLRTEKGQDINAACGQLRNATCSPQQL